MLTKLLKLAPALAFIAGTQIAHAFVDPPVLVPANPGAGQTVSINIRAGVCDAFTSDPPVITRSGNNLRIVLQSVSSPDPSFCIYPTGTYAFTVGAFDAGSYSLQVDRTYLGGGGPVTQTLGILPFAVTGLPATPTLDPLGTMALALALLAAAILTLRRRRPGNLSLRNRCGVCTGSEPSAACAAAESVGLCTPESGGLWQEENETMQIVPVQNVPWLHTTPLGSIRVLVSTAFALRRRLCDPRPCDR